MVTEKQNITPAKEEVESNYINYLERIAFYKSTGFDQEEARLNIVSHIKDNNRIILEIGTGKGYLTTFLANTCLHVVSVDINEDDQRIAMLNAAHAGVQNQISFLIADAEQLDFADHSFDAVVSAYTFHHLTNPFVVIGEMMRLAKNQLIISDFNENGLEIINKAHDMEGRKHDHKHNNFEIVGVYLKEHGFDVHMFEDNWQKIYIAERR
ncbi:MAG: class I SAM-dependent methyltransferase [Candidatus Margulisiibacteriota bacterium]